MAETPNPINAAPSSTLEVEHDDVEEALLKKLPYSGENEDKEGCYSVDFIFQCREIFFYFLNIL